jgi:hypothetical protein
MRRKLLKRRMMERLNRSEFERHFCRWDTTFLLFFSFYDCIMQAFRRIDGVLSSFYSLYH